MFKIRFSGGPFRIEHRKPCRVAISPFNDHVLAKDTFERET